MGLKLVKVSQALRGIQKASGQMKDAYISLVIILSSIMTKWGSKNARLTCATKLCIVLISFLVHPLFS
jgi:hypothetical protein